MHLGPQKLDYSISVPMTIIYCALWLFGMTGWLLSLPKRAKTQLRRRANCDNLSPIPNLEKEQTVTKVL